MPRFPESNPLVVAIGGSPYNALAHRLAQHPGETYPLHIGDTWMEPAVGCRMQDLTIDAHPGMHRYSPVQGRPELIDAIVDRTRERTGMSEERTNVLVTAGATAGLAAVAGAMLSPGDEVLIIAPFWPLIAGIVRMVHAVPVPVPVVGQAESVEALVDALNRATGPRTVALYLNTPNNPTGRVLPEVWVQAMAEFAARHDLWLISDEVYEDYVYEGQHTYARPLAPERTVSAYSLSKGYGMAGNRAGWLVGPAELLSQAVKVGVHTVYSTPTASQLAAVRALTGAGATWVASAAAQYAAAGAAAAARLGLPPPQGSTFLFFDVAAHLDERGLMGLLSDCVDQGLFIAPGSSFGPYPTHLRLCFTATEPERTQRGVEVLAGLLGR